MDLFLGIDLGTSYFKAGLFDENGRLCGLGRRPVPKYTPVDSVCELPVDQFWETLRLTIAQALREAEGTPDQVVALSYASQANSFLLLDKEYRPLTPIILWPDERAGDVHPDLQAFCQLNAWRVKTGMGIPLSKHSAVNKLLWFKSFDEVFPRAKFLLTISDYLVFRLTGQLFSDLSSASLLGLLDVQSGNWWPEAIACVLPGQAQVGNSRRSGEAAGQLTNAGAELLGLHTRSQFFMGGLDHHMAGIGAGVHTANHLSESTGTVLAAVRYTNNYSPKEMVCVAPGLDNEHFFNLAFDDNGAGFLEWYQRTKAPLHTITQLLHEATAVPPGCDGLRAVQVGGTNATPYQFVGNDGHYTHGHYVRAILEATAWRLSAVVEKLDAGSTNKIVSTGGGARSQLWTTIKAAITGRTFIIPECGEAACLGAAILAASGSGCIANAGWTKYKSLEEPNREEREQYLQIKQETDKAPTLLQ